MKVLLILYMQFMIRVCYVLYRKHRYTGVYSWKSALPVIPDPAKRFSHSSEGCESCARQIGLWDLVELNRRVHIYREQHDYIFTKNPLRCGKR